MKEKELRIEDLWMQESHNKIHPKVGWLYFRNRISIIHISAPN